jgi:pimeloyl-ACP methyl ester carboxylesterase
MLAIDDRVQFAFICAGGLQVQRSKQEIDPAIFTRRITIPVMSITGKNDGIFDYENSQVPMQKLLGTPLKDQEIIVLNNVGHLIPQDVMIENHLKWLKKYIK